MTIEKEFLKSIIPLSQQRQKDLKGGQRVNELPEGFIKDFTETLANRLPGVNRSYIRLCAEELLAGVSFKVCHYNKIGKMNLGLWGLVVTRSGEWKTVPIRDYLVPILKAVQSTIPPTGKLIKKIMVPSRFSPEGLIEFMTLHKEDVFNEETGEKEEILAIHNEGIMLRDEFTGMMRGIKTKDWMCDVSETLSEVYDSSVQPYYTKKDKLQEVPYCNVSFLMATTPYLYNILDDTFFIQGLGNRIDYVVFDPPENPPKLSPDDFFGEQDRGKKDDLIKNFAGKLSKITNSNVRFIGVDPESKVADIWVGYRNDIEVRKRLLSQRGLDPLKWAYLSRQAEKALRRAGIYCISRCLGKPLLMKSDTLILNEKDVSLAIQRQKEHYRYFETLLNRWVKEPEPRGRKSTDIADLERMLTIILDTPYKMISNPKWLKEAGYGFQNKFYYLKSVLIAQGDVRVLTDREIATLTKGQKTWLELHDPRIKVYRLTDQYFHERKLDNPFKKVRP